MRRVRTAPAPPLSSLLLLLTGLLCSAAPWTAQNSAWNVNLNPDTNPANYYGAWSNHVYFPSPDDWRKVPIYQFITDRFNDGEPANNELAYPGYNLRDVGARHGGDFLGVRDKLEYIRALGYKGIWISPVFQNRTNSYHGYGQIDYTLLDERFGTLADFRAMVSQAHALGLYVIVDIVVNHLENLYYFEGHPSDGAPFRLHSGEYQLLPRNPAETYTDFPVNNTWYPTGQYCDVFGDDGYRRTDTGSGSFWDSDLHHNGDLNDYSDPWQDHLGKIYGALDDLRNTHPRVQDKIIAMTKSLIASCDIDGIRMDTPMQVPRYFFQRWCPAVRAQAAALGKNDFFIFGEFYCSRERAATMVGRGKDPSMWGNSSAFLDGDFTMNGGINYRAYFDFFQSAVQNQSSGNLGNLKAGLDTDLTAYDFYDSALGQTSGGWRRRQRPTACSKPTWPAPLSLSGPACRCFTTGTSKGFAPKARRWTGGRGRTS
jgi:alpha-1,3-glucan synthase